MTFDSQFFRKFLNGAESKCKTKYLLEEFGKLIRIRYATGHLIGLLDKDENSIVEASSDDVDQLLCNYEEHIKKELEIAKFYFRESEEDLPHMDYPTEEFYYQVRVSRMSLFLEHVRTTCEYTTLALNNFREYHQFQSIVREDNSLNTTIHEDIKCRFLHNMQCSRDAFACAWFVSAHILHSHYEHLYTGETNCLKHNWENYVVFSIFVDNERKFSTPTYYNDTEFSVFPDLCFQDVRETILDVREGFFKEVLQLYETVYHQESTTPFLLYGSQIPRLGGIRTHFWFDRYEVSVNKRLKYLERTKQETTYLEAQLIKNAQESNEKTTQVSENVSDLMESFLKNVKLLDDSIATVWKAVNLLFVLGPHRWIEKKIDGSWDFWWRDKFQAILSHYDELWKTAQDNHHILTRCYRTFQDKITRDAIVQEPATNHEDEISSNAIVQEPATNHEGEITRDAIVHEPPTNHEGEITSDAIVQEPPTNHEGEISSNAIVQEPQTNQKGEVIVSRNEEHSICLFYYFLANVGRGMTL
jgi:hypothetical protein